MSQIQFDPNVPEDAVVLQEIREKAERAKKDLSKLPEVQIHLTAKDRTISRTVTRTEFEQRCQPLLDRIREKWLSAVQGGVGDVKNLQGIILVGGASRMPCINALIEKTTGGVVPIHKDISQDLAVAMGAAWEAFRLAGQTEFALKVKKIRDVTTFDIGVAAHKVGDSDPNRMYVRCIIPKGTPLPAKDSATFGLANMDAGLTLDAELTVAEGKNNEEFREAMKIQVFFLGDLPPSDDPTKPVIEVTITVDENGIVRAEAVHLPTGKKVEQQIDRKAIS